LEQHPHAIMEIKQVKIMQLIRYQWLERWLKVYQVEFSGLWEVWPVIPDSVARSLIVSSMTKYCSKRNIELEIPEKAKSYKDLARAFDRAMEPKLSFYSLVVSVHSTAKEMTRDISKTFKNMFEPHDADDPMDYLESAWQDSFRAEFELETTWSAELDPRSKPEDTILQDDENDVPAESTPVLVKKLQLETKNKFEVLANKPPTEVSAHKAEDEISLESFGALEDEFAEFNEDFGESKADTLTTIFGGDTSGDIFGYKSPLAELADKFGRTPDIITWCEAANTMPEYLRRVKKEEFQRIYDIGAALLQSEKENKAMEEYDV